MYARLYEMPFNPDLEQFREACQLILDELGCMFARGWPEPEVWLEPAEWLDDLFPECSIGGSSGKLESFVLTDKELARTCMPGMTTIYTIRDATLLLRFVLAASYFSEFAAIFVPLDVTRSELVQLLELGDYFSVPTRYNFSSPSSDEGYDQTVTRFVAGKWLISIGTVAISEETDSVLFLSDDISRITKIHAILQPVATRFHDIHR
ncbi:MAG: hypothetical protein AB7O26_12545 [Planctomycetaceae bacterium]